MLRRDFLAGSLSASTLILLTLPSTGTAQIRFASPNARHENQVKVQKLINEYNELAGKFNAQIDGQPAWIRKPEDTADVAAQMALKLNDIYSLLLHIDEVDK
jgi:hypothetical protein